MIPFTSPLVLTLVGSFDLQQHHLITSIAGRPIFVSFDGAEQRSFMQMPLQMNAQAIFCYLFAFFDSCENTQRCAEWREREEALTPFAFYFFLYFFKDRTSGGALLESCRSVVRLRHILSEEPLSSGGGTLWKSCCFCSALWLVGFIIMLDVAGVTI